MNDIVDKLKPLFVKALRIDYDLTKVPEEDLINHFGIDSITSLEILVWVENEFEITIEDQDLSPELVNSLNVLGEYIIQRKSIVKTGDY